MRPIIVLLAFAVVSAGQHRDLTPPTGRFPGLPLGPPPRNPRPPVLACAAVSADGKMVATGYSYDGTADRVLLRLWDAETGKEVRAVTCKGSVFSVVFTPDGNYVLTGGGGHGAFRLWDVLRRRRL